MTQAAASTARSASGRMPGRFFASAASFSARARSPSAFSAASAAERPPNTPPAASASARAASERATRWAASARSLRARASIRAWERPSRAEARLASSAFCRSSASRSRSSSSAVRRSRSFTVADTRPSCASPSAISDSSAGIAPRRLYLRRRCHSRSCASASDQLAPSSSPVETTETMRFSSSAEPLIALSPWPMKALRRNTSRVAPVSASPAEAPSSPGTRSSVPV